MTAIERTLAKARQAADQRAAANDDKYRDLIRRCAGGVEIAPEKVLSELDKLGKDIGEFQEAVESLAHRLDLRLIADTHDTHVEALADVREKIADVNAAREAEIQQAEAKHHAALQPLAVAESAASAAVARAEDARQKLANDCDDADRLAAIQAAADRFADARRRLDEARTRDKSAVERCQRELHRLSIEIPNSQASIRDKYAPPLMGLSVAMQHGLTQERELLEKNLAAELRLQSEMQTTLTDLQHPGCRADLEAEVRAAEAAVSAAHAALLVP